MADESVHTRFLVALSLNGGLAMSRIMRAGVACAAVFGVAFAGWAGEGAAGRLSLAQALKQAGARNPEIIMAQHDVTAKQGDIMEEYSKHWPRMRGLLLHRDEPYTGENHRTYNNKAQVQLEQPIYTFGYISSLVRKELWQQQAKGDDVVLKRWEVRYDVVRAYYDVVLKQETVRVRQMNMANSQARLSNVKARFAEGRAKSLDVKNAEVKVASDEADVATAEESLQVAAQKLNLLLDRPLQAPVVPSDRLEYEPLPAGSLLRAAYDTLPANPEIVKKDHERLAAESGKDAARAAQYPHFYFEFIWMYNVSQDKDDDGGGGTGGTAQAGSSSFENEYNTWHVGIFVDLPIMKRWVEAHGKSIEARAHIKKVRVAKAYMRRSLRVRIREAVADMTEADRNVKVTGRHVEALKVNLDNVTALQKEGKATAVDVSDAERELANAHLDHLKAVFQHKVAIAKLEKEAAKTVAEFSLSG